jgi:hypothetical protein
VQARADEQFGIIRGVGVEQGFHACSVCQVAPAMATTAQAPSAIGPNNDLNRHFHVRAASSCVHASVVTSPSGTSQHRSCPLSPPPPSPASPSPSGATPAAIDARDFPAILPPAEEATPCPQAPHVNDSHTPVEGGWLCVASRTRSEHWRRAGCLVLTGQRLSTRLLGWDLGVRAPTTDYCVV